MSVLDDARRLLSYMPPSGSGCQCDGVMAAPSRPHAAGCPWLSLPKIVAALEAAERLTREQYGTTDLIAKRYCHSHPDCPDKTWTCCACGRWSEDGPRAIEHAADCAGEALAAALKGDTA